jgi:hypothetical protein
MISTHSLALALALTPLGLSAGGCAAGGAGPQPEAVANSAAVQAAHVAEEPAVAVLAHPAFERRLEEVVAVMNGGGDPAATFAPAFLAQASVERIARLTRTMRDTYGSVQSVSRTELKTPYSGVVVFDLERSQMEVQLAVQPAAPHKVSTLLIRQPGR